VNPRNKHFILGKKNGKLHQLNPITATYDSGFNIKALQGLLNILNANQHMYFYYGSETVPPCREEVLWMVYARPRSISEKQFNFLKFQLSKHTKKKQVEEAQSRLELFGNKRSIQVIFHIK
jgi:carbonic anhydrase